MSNPLTQPLIDRNVKVIRRFNSLRINELKQEEAIQQVATELVAEGYKISVSTINQILFNEKYSYVKEARDFIKNEAASTNQTKFTGSINHPTKEVA